nr:MAG TPA: hypothetical protein [Caudoviricetes sp.]
MTAKKTTNTIEEEVSETVDNSVEQENKALKETLSQYQNIITQMQSTIANLQGMMKNSGPSMSSEVTLVYLSESLGVVSIDGLTLNCSRYGEQFQVSRIQFDQIVGKYRKWFDDGILAVGDNCVDVAAAKDIKTESEYVLNAKILNSIGKMTASELSKLWDKLTTPEERNSVVLHVKHKLIEGNPVYKDREKIDLLNRLTNGGFTREQIELSGMNTKYQPQSLI